jgi:hypothetical protein
MKWNLNLKFDLTSKNIFLKSAYKRFISKPGNNPVASLALVGTFTRYFDSPRRLGQPIFAPEVTRALEHGKKKCVNFNLGRCEKKIVASLALSVHTSWVPGGGLFWAPGRQQCKKRRLVLGPPKETVYIIHRQSASKQDGVNSRMVWIWGHSLRRIDYTGTLITVRRKR